MSDSEGGSPIQVIVVVLLLAGGGWYFFNNYEVGGLGGVSVSPRDEFEDDSFVSYRDAPVMIGPHQTLVANTNNGPITESSMVSATVASVASGSQAIDAVAPPRRKNYRSIKIASWALDGFGPTKLASADARNYVTKVVRRYDLVALQQVASIERDLVPRLIDVINGPEHRYDYVISDSTGPEGRGEQFAFLFDTTTLQIDRRQTYTLVDPADKLTYDPMVASFRAAAPSISEAWTFTAVNLRVNLARAAEEVAVLPGVLNSVHRDGRGEDDVLLMGLFQADDAYLLPTMGGKSMHAAVQHRSTDVFGRFQTSNLLIEKAATSEFLGRGGVFDYRRHHHLNPIEAEAVTSHLPVFAEFTAHEGGEL